MVEQQIGAGPGGQAGGVVAKAQEMGLAAADMKKQIQELFSTEGRAGLEGGVNKDNIVISRAKLLQGLSEEVKQDARTWQAGMIIDSVTKEPLPKSFIVLAQMPSSWIYFNPRDKKHKHFIPEFGPGDVVWQSNDPEDPRVKTHGAWKDDEPPAATEYINFLVYVEGSPIPLVLGFAKTSMQVGKGLYTMIVRSGGAVYTRKYELSSVSKNKNGNDFFVLQVRPAGKCTEDEVEIGRMLHEAFAPKLRDLKVHDVDACAEAHGE